MGLGFLLVMVVPWAQRFFELHLVGLRDPLTGAVIAVVAGVLLEIIWRFINHGLPLPERPARQRQKV
jgi:cation-transporting ATPase E